MASKIARRTLSLEPRQQLGRFIHELFSGEHDILPPEFTNGTLHIQSDGEFFSVLALNQDVNTGLSTVPASNDAIHELPVVVTGILIDLEGAPVAAHPVTLAYEARSPVTGIVEERSMIAVTAADGSFEAPLRNLVGTEATLMAGSAPYYSFVHGIEVGRDPVSETASHDLGNIQLIPAVEVDGVDALELLKFITWTDGSGPNTTLETWPEFPIPITYTIPEGDPATNIVGHELAVENALITAMLSERILEIAAGKPLVRHVDSLPTEYADGSPVLNSLGQRTGYGIEMIFRAGDQPCRIPGR